MKTVRKVLGLSQTEFAARAGWTPNAYSRVERGLNKASSSDAREYLARGAGVRTEDVVDWLNDRIDFETFLGLVEKGPEAVTNAKPVTTFGQLPGWKAAVKAARQQNPFYPPIVFDYAADTSSLHFRRHVTAADVLNLADLWVKLSTAEDLTRQQAKHSQGQLDRRAKPRTRAQESHSRTQAATLPMTTEVAGSAASHATNTTPDEDDDSK